MLNKLSILIDYKVIKEVCPGRRGSVRRAYAEAAGAAVGVIT
jgi:hypothetical protein